MLNGQYQRVKKILQIVVLYRFRICLLYWNTLHNSILHPIYQIDVGTKRSVFYKAIYHILFVYENYCILLRNLFLVI